MELTKIILLQRKYHNSWFEFGLNIEILIYRVSTENIIITEGFLFPDVVEFGLLWLINNFSQRLFWLIYHFKKLIIKNSNYGWTNS